ncbi:MAG: MFS transporter [Cyanobacteria bacterium P01_D01_bin.50]
MHETSEITKPRFNRGKKLILISVIVFLDFLSFGILIPLIPGLVRQFSTQAFVLGLTFSAFAIGQLIMSPLLGVLSDKYGRRLILLTSTLGGMVASYLLVFANGIWLILVSRFLDGLTGGNLLAGQAYIADITEPEQRAKNFGLLGVSIGIAFILGPALGGILSSVSIQAPAIVAGTLYLMTAILVWFGLPESLPVNKRRRKPIRWIQLNPLIQIIQAFKRQSLRLLLGVTFLLNFAENGLRSNLQVLTAERFSLAIEQNAILFSYLGVISALMQGIAIRWLTKRFPEQKLTIAGLGLMILGYTGIALAPSVVMLYVSLTFNVVGFSIASPTLLSSLSKGVSDREQGFLMGAIQIISTITLIVSPALVGFQFDKISTGAPYWTGGFVLLIATLTLFQNYRIVKYR